MSVEDDKSAIETAFVSIVLRRLDKLEDHMESDRLNSSESRRRLHDKIDGLEKSMDGLDRRLEVMEKAVTSTSPFFTEYMAFKERAIGASMVGRWLWFIGGILISAVASSAAVYAWLISHTPIPK